MAELKIENLYVTGPDQMLTIEEPQESFESYVVWLKPNQKLTIVDGISEGQLRISYTTIAKMCSSSNVLL